MSDISSYLTDHSNAGTCAYNYYNGIHDPNACRVSPGVCSVIAYLVAELKNAEWRAAAPQENSGPQPRFDPLNDPMPSGGTGNNATTYQMPSSGSGGGGSVGWNTSAGGTSYPVAAGNYGGTYDTNSYVHDDSYGGQGSTYAASGGNGSAYPPGGNGHGGGGGGA